MCAQLSPGSNHPGHGFGDCNAECSSSSKSVCYRFSPSGFLKFGEYVLVRCNQSKWLDGQVRRATSTSIKVWIGAAETLVNVPQELFPTHLARMDCPTPFSSRTDSHSPGFSHKAAPDIKARVQCVRPAHLAHRHLYQFISPVNSSSSNPQVRTIAQMHQAQSASPAPKDPRIKYESYSHCFPPTTAPSPSNLPKLVTAYFEMERGPVSKRERSPKILKHSSGLSEPLNTVREESNPLGEFSDVQVQYNWRQHVARSSQQGKRPSYPRPLALPMLNVNLNNEDTPMC